MPPSNRLWFVRLEMVRIAHSALPSPPPTVQTTTHLIKGRTCFFHIRRFWMASTAEAVASRPRTRHGKEASTSTQLLSSLCKLNLLVWFGVQQDCSRPGLRRRLLVAFWGRQPPFCICPGRGHQAPHRARTPRPRRFPLDGHAPVDCCRRVYMAVRLKLNEMIILPPRYTRFHAWLGKYE